MQGLRLALGESGPTDGVADRHRTNRDHHQCGHAIEDAEHEHHAVLALLRRMEALQPSLASILGRTAVAIEERKHMAALEPSLLARVERDDVEAGRSADAAVDGMILPST